MFDVTPDDIAQLKDDDLRKLVARLAAAELVQYGQSVHAVTDGGHQDAPDGGADVRVSLATGALAGPNLPRSNIVYQVKRPDMPRNKILQEMRPGGQLRPVIAELMAVGGAYIIVSSQGSTADKPLRDRCSAMREALDGYPDAHQLFTDFYDRSRVANWCREHPGLVLWLRETLGRPIFGWHPYGNWTAQNSRPEDQYLVDEKVKVRFAAEDSPEMAAAGAISRLRTALNVPGASLRLVGLSGVGKTRLAQALFDNRIGADALPQAAAVYTNFQDRLTNPQPEIMATQLVAQQRRAILIVDNCGVGTHRALTQICRVPSSTVSLLTIEYDVHDDEAEETQVVEMGFASDLFIEDLLCARYKELSRENRNTIALVSGGNARIAIAIAETVRAGDRLAGLRSSEIFDRLFHQRNEPNPELLLAAEACSLVYSFDGETEAGNQAELPLLAELAGLNVEVFFRHMQTLGARELVQSRSIWRALLPHALANRLAERALENFLESRIRRHLIDSGNQRLLRSFAYRLSFLHTSPKAVAWCQEFLRPGGILGQVLELSPEQRLMLSYVAPVVPGDVLSAFERAAYLDHEGWLSIEHSYKEILRQIAWDGSLFARCVALLERTVRANRRKYEVDNAVLILATFCQPILSGTHATADQIFELVEQWLSDQSSAVQNLGRNALTRTLFSQFQARDFNFGARKRDGGRYPQSQEEWIEWYTRGLGILERLAQPGGIHTDFAREEFTRQVRSLWSITALRPTLSAMFTSLAAGSFWREAWTTVQSMLRYGRVDSEGQELLRQLEQDLAPRGLSARVMAEVHYDETRWSTMEAGEDYSAVHQRMETAMASLGRELARDLPTLRELIPKLMVQHGLIEELCVGLGQEASVEQPAWVLLTNEWSRHREQTNSVPSPNLLRGFLRGLVARGNVDVEYYLSQCASSSDLAAALPALQAAVGFSIEGLSRIESKYSEGLIPVKQMEWLRGAVHKPIEVQHAALTLLVQVAIDDLGIRTAIDTIQTWLKFALQPGAIPDPVVVDTCQRILERVSFAESDTEEPYRVFRLAEIGIRGQGDDHLASSLSTRMCHAAVSRYSLYYEYEDLILLLLERTPEAMLTALCHSDDQRLQMAGASLLENASRDGQNRLARVEPARIATWCALAPTLRIPFAMRVIPAVTTDAESGQAHLTDHAMAILRIADDPLNALAQLVERIEQETYRNSRGSMLEHHAAALDDVMDLHDDVYQRAACAAQLRLRAEAAEELRIENDRDRRRNERFEP